MFRSIKIIFRAVTIALSSRKSMYKTLGYPELG